MAVVCDPERVRTRAADLVATSQEFLQASWARHGDVRRRGARSTSARPPCGASRTSGTRARELGMMWWSVSPFARTGLDPPSRRRRRHEAATTSCSWACTPPRPTAATPPARSPTPRAGWRTAGAAVYVTEAHGPAARTVEVLGGEGIAARLDADLGEIAPSVVHVACGCARQRLRRPGAQARGAHRDRPVRAEGGRQGRGPDARPAPQDRSTRSPSSPATTSCTSSTASAATSRWCSAPCRAPPASTCSSSTPRPSAASPATGSSSPPTSWSRSPSTSAARRRSLHRLGGADWTKTKARAKKAVKEIAADLIKLYSARMAAPGHAFGADTPWQRELEDAFPYAETPDQLTTIGEVKEDMEKSVPMDRLICGDVGYGKTEIAVRAAFKAVQDGKQVAVLVPTTLLVQQHFSHLHRALRAVPRQRAGAVPLPDGHRGAAPSLDGLREGSVDIVIGTHRLFSSEHQVQGPGPGHRRRGAALRRRAQGAAEEAPRERGRADHVRHAHPAHAGDGGHRHPRDVDDHHAAGGAAPGADLRRPVRGEADRRRHPA